MLVYFRIIKPLYFLALFIQCLLLSANCVW